MKNNKELKRELYMPQIKEFLSVSNHKEELAEKLFEVISDLSIGKELFSLMVETSKLVVEKDIKIVGLNEEIYKVNNLLPLLIPAFALIFTNEKSDSSIEDLNEVFSYVEAHEYWFQIVELYVNKNYKQFSKLKPEWFKEDVDACGDYNDLRKYFIKLTTIIPSYEDDFDKVRFLLFLGTICYKNSTKEFPKELLKQCFNIAGQTITKLTKLQSTGEDTEELHRAAREALYFLIQFKNRTEPFIRLVNLVITCPHVLVNNDLTYPLTTSSGINLNSCEYPSFVNRDWYLSDLKWMVNNFKDISFNELSISFSKKLKTKKCIDISDIKDDSFIEPEPIKRLFYVNAIGAINNNFNGKLHHVLNFIRDNDPNRNIQKAASSVYRMLKHNRVNKDRPRTTLNKVLVCLIETHCLILGKNEYLDNENSKWNIVENYS